MKHTTHQGISPEPDFPDKGAFRILQDGTGQEPAGVSQEEPALTISHGNTPPARILIIEDEAVQAMCLTKSLIDSGYTVCGVSVTGEEGVQKAGELRPDIILMDIQLAGEMDGILAAENILARYHIPIVYLTAFVDDRYLQKARFTEPFGYLLKPVREHELRATIEMALYKNTMETNLRIRGETNRVLLNENADLHYLVDTRGILLAGNETLAKKVGKPAAQLRGMEVSGLVECGHLSPRMAHPDFLRLHKESIRFEEMFNGAWFDIGIHPVCNPAGHVITYAIHIHDISMVKNTEEQLRQNDEYFRALIENVSEITVILDRDGTIRSDSPLFSQAAGSLEEKSAHRNFFEMLQADSADRARSIFAEILSTPIRVKPFRVVLKTVSGVDISMAGIFSNLLDNPVIGGILLNGWITVQQSSGSMTEEPS